MNNLLLTNSFNSSWPGLPPSLKLWRPSTIHLARRSLGVGGTRPSSETKKSCGALVRFRYAPPRPDGRLGGGHDEKGEA
jgi:hypothetical protein